MQYKMYRIKGNKGEKNNGKIYIAKFKKKKSWCPLVISIQSGRKKVYGHKVNTALTHLR